jgi:HAE1 family hydrophobic/amphiphilic exporter-1
MESAYKISLRFSLKQRLLVIILAAITVYSSGWFMSQLGKEFMPNEDEARFIISLKTPLGSSIEYTRDRLVAVEDKLLKHSEISGLFSTIGTGDRGQVNQGQIYVSLIPHEKRRLHQTQFIKQVRIELAQIPGIKAFAAPVPVVGGERGDPLQFVLKGPNLEKVAELATKLELALRKIPEIGPLDTDLQLDMPELKLQVDREKARDLGVDTFTLSNVLRVLVGGLDVAKYNDEPGDGERYDIRLKAKAGTFINLADINYIYLRNQQGELVRLDTVAHFEQKLSPATISRYKLQYSATFFATPTISEGDAAMIVLQKSQEILPTGYQVELIGKAKELSKTVGYMLFVFATGLILVYMTLASQFDSFIQPLIVMVAQPLAIIGGIFGLWIAGHSLNIYSIIGLVLLVGLVAKNSILLGSLI